MGLRRPFRVVATPSRLAPSGPAATLNLAAAVLAPVEPFQWVGRQNLSQSQESLRALNAAVPVARRPMSRREPGLSYFLKNNIKSQPVWQELVDFSESSVPALDRAFRCPSGMPKRSYQPNSVRFLEGVRRPLRERKGGRASDPGPGRSSRIALRLAVLVPSPVRRTLQFEFEPRDGQRRQTMEAARTDGPIGRARPGAKGRQCRNLWAIRAADNWSRTANPSTGASRTGAVQ